LTLRATLLRWPLPWTVLATRWQDGGSAALARSSIDRGRRGQAVRASRSLADAAGDRRRSALRRRPVRDATAGRARDQSQLRACSGTTQRSSRPIAHRHDPPCPASLTRRHRQLHRARAAARVASQSRWRRQPPSRAATAACERPSVTATNANESALEA
jgi:hypothetical protein